MSGFGSLFWKEFHELRWRVAFGVVTMAGFAAIGLRARIIEDEGVVLLSCFFGLFAFPLFVCMGSIAEDREDGSSRFLNALPVSPKGILDAKLLSGLVAVVFPILVTWIVVTLLAGEREMSSRHIWQRYVLSMISAFTCFLWYFTFSARQPTQWRVGLVGIAVMATWVLLATSIPNAALWSYVVFPVLAGLIPLLTLICQVPTEEATEMLMPLMIVVFVQVLTMALLVRWLRRRFSTETRRAR
jgi:hypothetical protein